MDEKKVETVEEFLDEAKKEQEGILYDLFGRYGYTADELDEMGEKGRLRASIMEAENHFEDPSAGVYFIDGELFFVLIVWPVREGNFVNYKYAFMPIKEVPNASGEN